MWRCLEREMDTAAERKTMKALNPETGTDRLVDRQVDRYTKT